MTDEQQQALAELALRHENADLYLAVEELRQEWDELHDALCKSVKLQSHYAELLNSWDGGERTVFSSAADWLKRLREVAERAEI